MRKTSIQILGVRINLVDYESVLSFIKKCIRTRSLGHYICVCPVHPIMVSRSDHELKSALDKSLLAVPDGMPVVWAARLLGASIKERVYGPDLMLKTCKMAEEAGYSIFLYGGEPATLDKLIGKLLHQFPRLQIAGAYSPPFRKLLPGEKTAMIGMIKSTSPDILFVGLGVPKQEKWMADACPSIRVPVSIGVGAAFDFLSGEKKQAPGWMQYRGLEWLFRLANEPRRLWARYLVYNNLFIILFMKQFLSERKSSGK